jgi:hypothetical protein
MSEPPIEGPLSVRETGDMGRLEQLQDYSAALGTIRAARGVFLLILVLSLLVHVAAYSAARWGHLLEPLTQLQEPRPPSVPASTPAAKLASGAEKAPLYSIWYYVVESALPLAEFLGQVSCVLLAVSFLFAALVCLSGGLGGVRGSIAAFYWTLVLFVLLFPWGRWLATSPGAGQVPGVYYTVTQLRELSSVFPDRIQEVRHYLRFLGYPLLALLIILTADSRFRGGCRLVQRHLESCLRMRRI